MMSGDDDDFFDDPGIQRSMILRQALEDEPVLDDVEDPDFVLPAPQVQAFSGPESVPPPPVSVVDDDLETADRVARNSTADELGKKVEIRQGRFDDFERIAPFARANPPTSLRGTLGGQQLVTSGGPVLQVANWAGEDPEALPVAVTLANVGNLGIGGFPTPADGGGSLFSYRPFARIKWGTRAWSAEVEVDIGRGTQFTVGASAVTVQVGLDPAPPAILLGATSVPGLMQLAGMLSFYPVPRFAPITRTRYDDAHAAVINNTTNFIIPAFAENVTFWRNPVAGTSVRLDVLDPGGIVIYQIVIAAGAVMIDPMPLSADAHSINVVNLLAVGFDARLIFGLSL